tara:strand:+ start:42 stop:890 length:849 start_codon:yes stop_codon:yes gene_type:complete
MESNLDIKTQIIPRVLTHTFRAELPMQIVDMMNKYIDEDVIPHDPSFGEVAGNSKVQNSYTRGLVGQIRQDKRSAQLDFDIYNTDTGKIIKELLDKCCTQYLTGIGHGDTHPDVFEAWTVHSYAGDYNPLHDHGVKTPGGLSMIIYLQVPKCISDLPSPDDDGSIYFNDVSGHVDGFTYFNWSNLNKADIRTLYRAGEEYVKPKVGTLLIFPNWMKHAVMPFFGEGERRTFSANCNLYAPEMLGTNFTDMPEEKQNQIKGMFKSNSYRYGGGGGGLGKSKSE